MLSRLAAVLGAYASICFHRGRHPSADVSALVHERPEVADAERRLRAVFAALIEEAAAGGVVRTDVGAEELGEYFTRWRRPVGLRTWSRSGAWCAWCWTGSAARWTWAAELLAGPAA